MIEHRQDRKMLIAALIYSGLAKGYIEAVNINAEAYRDFDIYNVTLGLPEKIDEFNAMAFNRFSKLGVSEEIQKEIDRCMDKFDEILK